MISAHNERVAARFAASVADYDAHAGLQANVAAHLAGMLPALDSPSVLEVGCGTGFLTRHLLDAYPKGDFLVTDIAPAMVEACRANFGSPNGRAVRFAVMDGESPDCGGEFDLIALAMTAQWFADPRAGLEGLRGMLKPGGVLLYATLGPDAFPEWRAALAAGGLPAGLVEMPQLPGVTEEERLTVGHDSGRAFLARIRSMGAGEPKPGYRPLPPGSLRAALRRLERDHDARVTWYIVYGCLTR